MCVYMCSKQCSCVLGGIACTGGRTRLPSVAERDSVSGAANRRGAGEDC